MTWLLAEIKDAFDAGVEMGATHMIVAWDSFDGDNYPIYVMPGQNPQDRKPTNGDGVDECYRLDLGWTKQSAEQRANHWEWDEPREEPEPVLEAEPDARVEAVGRALYEQESSKLNILPLWPELQGATRGVYRDRAVSLLEIADNF